MSKSKSVIPPGRWQVGNDDYHADRTAESSSTLKAFRESPELYFARYIEGSVPMRAQTDDMIFGNAVHEALFEPDTFEENYAFKPETYIDEKNGIAEPLNYGYNWQKGAMIVDGNEEKQLEAGAKNTRWREHRAFRDEWIAANEDKFHLDQSDSVRIQGMIAQMKSHTGIAEFLDHPDTEFEVAYRLEINGVSCKVKFDLLNVTLRRIGDLKTARFIDEDQLSREIINRDYHIQSGMYHHAAEEMMGEGVEYIYIFSHKEPMYECERFKLGKKTIDLGKEKLYETLERFKACQEFDHWRTVTHGRDDVEIDAPGWAFRNK